MFVRVPFLWIASVLPAQPATSFTPNATVVMKDGATVELSDFCFASGGGRSRSFGETVTGLWVKEDDLWREIPFPEIERLSLSQVEDSESLAAEITLVGGRTLKAQTPPHGTWGFWWTGDEMVLKGRRSVFGVEGTWRLALLNVRSVTKSGKDKGPYDVTDTGGQTVQVSDLELVYTGADDSSSKCLGKDAALEVEIDRTKISLKLEIIRSLAFLRYENLAWNVEITKKTGEKATGRAEWLGAARGRTQAGHIWLRWPDDPILEIRFK